MPNIKSGTYVPCIHCGTVYYKQASDDKFKKRATCGASKCRSLNKTGENNPFWGKTHTPETIAKLSENGKRRPSPKSTKGYRHTDESRAKMSATLKTRWAERREFMMSLVPRGEDHHWKKDAELIRHRVNFTPVQRREWKAEECFWCKATDDLVLDHVLPVVAGGKNERVNCQTLCRECNLWKMWFVDRPLAIAMKVTSGAD